MGVDPAEYLLSVCGNVGFIKFLSNLKSGQYFLYKRLQVHDQDAILTQNASFAPHIALLGEAYDTVPRQFDQSIFVTHRVKMPHIRAFAFRGHEQYFPHTKRHTHKVRLEGRHLQGAGTPRAIR